jgi:hypothetical protein
MANALREALEVCQRTHPHLQGHARERQPLRSESAHLLVLVRELGAGAW